MSCSALAMARIDRAKRSVHFSKPRNKDGITPLQSDLDIKFLIQRHVRPPVLRVPGYSALTHLHRLYSLCQGLLFGIRTRGLSWPHPGRWTGRCRLQGRGREMFRQKGTSKLVFDVFRGFRLRRCVSRTLVRGWVSVSEATIKALRQPLDFDPTRRNSLDTERVTALGADGWLPLLRLHGIYDEGLETELGTPFESAAAAFLLHVVRRVMISCIPMNGRTVVKIGQYMVLAIDMSAFIAFYLEKVEFFAILERAAVTDVFEKRSVMGHHRDCTRLDANRDQLFYHNAAR